MSEAVEDGTVEIRLPDGTRAGYMRPWMNDPNIWDSWVVTERGPDNLVMNGSGRAWAEYMVLRVWQWILINTFHELAGRARSQEERMELRALVGKIQDCGTRMGELISEHATDVERSLDG